LENFSPFGRWKAVGAEEVEQEWTVCENAGIQNLSFTVHFLFNIFAITEYQNDRK
jgi:hypothetical protein